MIQNGLVISRKEAEIILKYLKYSGMTISASNLTSIRDFFKHLQNHDIMDIYNDIESYVKEQDRLEAAILFTESYPED